MDIGTAAANGTAAFSNLRIDTAGSNKQLTASASGLSNAVSAAFTVSPAAASALVIQTQPPGSVAAGSVFSPAPVVQIQDVFGNVVTSDSSTVVSATRNAGTAALQGTTSVTVVNGSTTFANLSYDKAETITIDFGGGSLAGTTSGSIAVTAPVANRLTIATQPSASATAGVVFGQQPVVRLEDVFGNLSTSDNSTVVTATRSTGSGTLQFPIKTLEPDER